jgi:hypothetical protein
MIDEGVDGFSDFRSVWVRVLELGSIAVVR